MANQFGGSDPVIHTPKDDPKAQPRAATVHEVSPDGSGYRIRYDDDGTMNHLDRYVPEEELSAGEKDADDSVQDDLSVLTLAELKELPEWQEVPNKSDLSLKSDIVKAIKKVRRQK